MPADLASFAFIISLAAVVNGLGIVRWVTGLAEYLRQKDRVAIQSSWVYYLFAAFQFLLHILMWWSLWSVRGAPNINFVTYIYVLAGPILLYLGTSVIAPEFSEEGIDFKSQYERARPTYSTVLALLWLWAIFTGLVLRGEFGDPVPVYSAFLATAVVQRVVANPAVQGGLAVLNWLLVAALIGLYAMTLGGANPAP